MLGPGGLPGQGRVGAPDSGSRGYGRLSRGAAGRGGTVGGRAEGYGTVRTVEAEAVEPDSSRPLRECLVADCGALPAGADLAGIQTWVREARGPRRPPFRAVPCAGR